MRNWISTTQLADTAPLLPAAALCLIWLLMGGATRLALWWCVLLLAGLTVVPTTKIAFLGWGIAALDFTGISGHAMRAAAIMPVLLYLVFIHASWQVLFGAIAAGMAFGVVIGSRPGWFMPILRPRQLPDACSGLELSATFVWMMSRAPQPALRFRERRALPLLLLLLVPLFAAKPAPAERWLHKAAMTFSGHENLYSRGYDKRGSGV